MRTLLGVMILGAATAVLGWLGIPGASTSQAEWVEVRSEPIVRTIKASGELESASKLTIGANPIRRVWDFTITDIVDEGVEVEEGTPLVSFDTQKLHERLQVKQSELETVEKELEKTRLEQRERVDKLELQMVELESELIKLRQKLDVPADLQKRIELDQLRVDDKLKKQQKELLEQRLGLARQLEKTAIRTAEQKVERLQRIVRQLNEAIEKMTVNAPRSGFVVHVPNWRGEKPKKGQDIWLGMPLIELADLSNMNVKAEVAEPDAALVRVGQTVEVRLDASPERIFKGRIEKLGKLFRVKSDEVPIVIFDALIKLDETDEQLMRPGMATSIEIIAESNDVAIQIPEEAVSLTDDGPVVLMRRGGSSQTTSVQLGKRASGKVVVTGGLDEGDQVQVPFGGA